MTRLHSKWFALPFIFIAATYAHAADPQTDATQPKIAEKAQTALKPFKQQLKATLLKGLEEGPAEAVASCNIEAPKIANDASGKDITVGRTSHKLRNPGNAPKDWMKPLLDAYRKDASAPYRVTRLKGGGYGYVEPIMLQPMCVNCHGADAQLDPKVKAKLDELYPSDEATGFAPDDFRGLFWVELKESALR